MHSGSVQKEERSMLLPMLCMAFGSQLFVGLLVSSLGDSTVSFEADRPAGTALSSQTIALAEQIFGTLPAKASPAEGADPLTREEVALGRILFHDPRLSGQGNLSCSTCHDLGNFGVDGRSVSTKLDGQTGRNVPTVLNAALQEMQFWDGRAANVEEQARMALLNPDEMGMANAESVEEVLRSIPGYQPLFKAAFPGDADPFTLDNVARALGAFERQLITRAPFDRFLKGQRNALRAEQLEGFQLFMGLVCTTCHMGNTVGGMMIQKIGLIKPYPSEDQGRYEVTKLEDDRFFFKVPQLRNVAKTAPYLHDGSLETLEEVVRVMAEYQLARELTDREVSALVAFLESLTGRLSFRFTGRPELPK